MSSPSRRAALNPPATTRRGRSASAAAPSPPASELCPRCRGSFVVTQLRDGKLSVECPLCGRLWAWARTRWMRSRPSA